MMFSVLGSGEDIGEREDGLIYIYKLINIGEVIYVGQTKDLKRRCYSHMANGKDFDSVDFKLVNADKANDEEAVLIVEFNPEANKLLPENSMFVNVRGVKDRLSEIIDSSLSLAPLAHTSDYNNGKRTVSYISSELSEEIISALSECCEKLNVAYEKERSK